LLVDAFNLLIDNEVVLRSRRYDIVDFFEPLQFFLRAAQLFG
jgi:hypothetical protein